MKTNIPTIYSILLINLQIFYTQENTNVDGWDVDYNLKKTSGLSLALFSLRAFLNK